MKKLTKLTADQVALIAIVRDEWLAHGLSTERADRARTMAGAADAYKAAGLQPPQITVWLDSPLAGVIGAAMLQKVWGQVGGQVGDQVWGQVRGQVGDQVGDQVRDQVGDQVGDQVWGQVRDQVRDQVRGQVWGQVRDQVRGQVRGQVWGQVGDQVRDQVWGQVGDQVRGQVGGQVRDQVWGQVRDQVGDQDLWIVAGYPIYGQHEAGYFSYFDYYRRCGHPGLAELVAPLTGQLEVAMSSGWWWPYRGAAVFTERPTILHRDAQGRLHSTNGPAIAYPDGWAIWAIHGVRVPATVVEHPEKITVERILEEQNTEIRRVMLDQFGWDRFADSGQLRLVDEQADPGNPPHTVRLYDLPKGLREVMGTPVRLILVHNATAERDGTRRSYGLTVPADMPDAISAVAWTFSVSAAEYNLLERAT